MRPWKKIGCPVDFSEPSRLALLEAAYLGRTLEGALTVLYVHEPTPELVEFYGSSPREFEALLPELERRLATWAREAGAPCGHVSWKVLRGAPTEEILRCAKAENFDVIVMGTHGRTGLKHLLLGSVAERVIRGAPCPVLVVRS